MSDEANVTAAPQRARMSTKQMLHLMRLEVDLAIRHGYPISCMYYGLDGFYESETLLHRKVLMPLVFQELKKVCVANDVRGMGIWTEGFQLAVFPHVNPDQIQVLADELLQRARSVEHADVSDELAVTLSIGISHNLHAGEPSFESLVKDAESGMSMALTSGGDQVARWRAVESALDSLRAELEEQLQEIEKVSANLFSGDGGDDELWGKQLVKKVLEVFAQEPEQSEGVLRLEKNVISLLKTELAAWSETSSASVMIDAQKQISQLERRITKLTQSLSATEAELTRVASMKDIDVGVASLYRTVQGLTGGDDQYEAKAEMLKNIFDANVALRAEMASKE